MGRRPVLTFPLPPPPQKNRSPPSDSSPETLTPGGISSLSRTSPVRSLGERTLGFVDAPDQEEAPGLQIPRVRGFCPVAVPFERRPCRVEGLRRPAQDARDERDLGLGDDAPRAGHGLFRTEGTRGTSQERLRPSEIAELRHRDAAKRESRRVARRATGFKAPRGSPAARARAAAVISESVGIPSHLSLPSFEIRRYPISCQRPLGRLETPCPCLRPRTSR